MRGRKYGHIFTKILAWMLVLTVLWTSVPVDGMRVYAEADLDEITVIDESESTTDDIYFPESEMLIEDSLNNEKNIDGIDADSNDEKLNRNEDYTDDEILQEDILNLEEDIYIEKYNSYGSGTYSPIMLQVPYFPQKVTNGCGISAVAMIYAYNNNLGAASYNSVYEKVYSDNNESLDPTTVCNKYGFRNIDKTLSAVYTELQKGNAVLVYRIGDKGHWSVIVGYNGSSTQLEKSGFIVWDTASGTSVAEYNQVTSSASKKDFASWMGSCTWKYAKVCDHTPVIQFWGVTNGDSFSGDTKIWAKRNDNDSNHYAELYIDGAVVQRSYSDASGYFSFSVNTRNYTNGAHTIKVAYYNSSSAWDDTRSININNAIHFWGVNNGDSFSGEVQIQAKRSDSDSNFYAELYVDGNVVQKLYSAPNGYFSFSVNTRNYTNGAHTIKVAYYNSSSAWDDTRSININNIVNNLDEESPNIDSLYISKYDGTGYEVIANVSDNVGVSRVEFLSWPNDGSREPLWMGDKKFQRHSGSALFQ